MSPDVNYFLGRYSLHLYENGILDHKALVTHLEPDAAVGFAMALLELAREYAVTRGFPDEVEYIDKELAKLRAMQ